MKLSPETIIKRADRAFTGTERVNVEDTWSLLAEFILNNQSGIFNGSRSPGTRRTERLMDSTAIQASHDLAAAIHATLTNPATQWSKIRYKIDELNNRDDTVNWLEEANKAIHNALNESNFDIMVSKSYQMFTSLGTMFLFAEERKRENPTEFNGLQFSSWHLSEIAFSENHEGVVDTAYRKFKLTARQAFERWDKEVPKVIIECLKDRPDEEFEFIHAVYPRDAGDVKLNSKGLAPGKSRPFASVYLHHTEPKFIEESGFYEFPGFAVRWSTLPGEVYGRGPGHLTLPDIRTLNRVKELSLRALSKGIDPPILAEQRNILGALDLRPGKITQVRSIEGFRELQTASRIDYAQFSIEELRASIKSGFFLDKLMLPPRTETGEMTAYEIARRQEEMQRVLGPTLSRLNNEFLTPLIVRVFKMLLRANALPPMPEPLLQLGLDVQIEFVNQLARSQQIQDVINIQSWVQDLGMLAQLKPEVIDYIDADAIAKDTARKRGVPEIAVTNDDVVAAARQQRAQMQQQQMMLQGGVQAADIASKLGVSGESIKPKS